MADKNYRMTINLSDGTSIDAGTFTAPQGPQGEQGPAGSTTAATDRHVNKSITSTGTDNEIMMCEAQTSKHSVFVGGVSCGDSFYFESGSNKTANITSSTLYPAIAYNTGSVWIIWYNGTVYSVSGTGALYLNTDSTDDRLSIYVYGKEIN